MAGPVIATYNRWIRDWPLRRSPNALVQLTLVGIIAPSSICQKQGIDAASLQQFGKFDPVFKFALRCRLVFGVLQSLAFTSLYYA